MYCNWTIYGQFRLEVIRECLIQINDEQSFSVLLKDEKMSDAGALNWHCYNVGNSFHSQKKNKKSTFFKFAIWFCTELVQFVKIELDMFSICSRLGGIRIECYASRRPTRVGLLLPLPVPLFHMGCQHVFALSACGGWMAQLGRNSWATLLASPRRFLLKASSTLGLFFFCCPSPRSPPPPSARPPSLTRR